MYRKILVLGRYPAVESSVDGTLGDRAGILIGGEGPRRAAEHIARHLIEQDGQCDATFGALLPAPQLPAGRLGERLREARPDLLVESWGWREPVPRAVLGKPESENLLDAVLDFTNGLTEDVAAARAALSAATT